MTATLTAVDIFDEAVRHHLAGQLVRAIAGYTRALAVRPNYAEAHNNLGVILTSLRKAAEGVTHYEQALGLKPDFADAHVNLAIALVELGRIEEAAWHYDRAIGIDPSHVQAHFNRAEIRKFRPQDPGLASLEEIGRSRDLPPKERALIHFALGKAWDDVAGHSDDAADRSRAFAHWRTANDLKRRLIRYDGAPIARLFDRAIAAYDADLIARPGDGDPSQAPVFVVGMPRSGSSLVEQILAGHPQVFAAGEREDFELALNAALSACRPARPWPECIRSLDPAVLRSIAQDYLRRLSAGSAGKNRIVDKMPANFLYVGLIRMVFPNARIVHTVRDPVDTCVSCYSKHFTSGQHYSYNLAELGGFYRGYARVMAHWRAVLPPHAMLEIHYEDVVNDLETEAKKLIAFCGLGWDGKCLNFQTAARAVQTASAAQIRRPMFRTSIGRWKKYAPWLGPLLAELGDMVSVTEASPVNVARISPSPLTKSM